MIQKITKTVALIMLGFIASSTVVSAASEFTGTLGFARSTDSMTTQEGTLSANNANGSNVSTSGGSTSTSGSGSSSGGRSGGGSGGSSASNDTSATDRIIIVPESNELFLAGTGGGYDPRIEDLLAGTGGSDSGLVGDSSISSEDLLALNSGATPTFLGGEQAAAVAQSSLGTGTIALIALGTIALVGAIGYGVNSALGMRRNDRL